MPDPDKKISNIGVVENQVGFVPCFSLHNDDRFPIMDAYSNATFINKIEEFLQAIIECPSTQALREKIHPKGGIQPIDPYGKSKEDRELCRMLAWNKGKVYRVDYGKNPFRIIFGLSNRDQRCYILALDSYHQTRNNGKNKR